MCSFELNKQRMVIVFFPIQIPLPLQVLHKECMGRYFRALRIRIKIPQFPYLANSIITAKRITNPHEILYEMKLHEPCQTLCL